jgi:hypothetical protein
VVVLVDILQFLANSKVLFKPYCKQLNFIPKKMRLPFSWNLFYDAYKAKFHLSNGLRLKFDNYILIEDLYPVVWSNKAVQTYIAKYKKIG